MSNSRYINMPSLGILCAEARRYMGYTQDRVARETNCVVSNISNFERGYNSSIDSFMWYYRNCFMVDEHLMKRFIRWINEH